ncbi:SDR family oxidoreductase [Nocardia bovistercoris]|uniref:SDR family oxidoreductase n=1 Tax=Nocardia bovistercoris TaxID=2785916 RepID=A0A931N3M2_9NOCA|nr:SDR family oxidoreductase [Nocardia bovistercoris]MBH0777877.1 SDR family oxidoreductase [Nocardia bovistercoris]
MKVVVIGGTGLIGAKVVARLRDEGHDALAASPGTGVNTRTGAGLEEALRGARVVVDVSNSPSFEDAAVLDFFTGATTNLLTAESAAGVTHHVALSVVGAERLTDSGYMRAKVAQEQLIESSTIPYSIVRATQFFEFFEGIARSATGGDRIRLTSAAIQPMAAADVSAAVARVALGAPLNGTLEIGGPEVFRLADFVADGLRANGDPGTVSADPEAPYFGAVLSGPELLPDEGADLSHTTFDTWLAEHLRADSEP